MPKYRVLAVREYYFETTVEADTAADAGVKAGDMIRAGQLQPSETLPPSISSMDVYQIPADATWIQE